jgi:uncharacterized protein YndB with AHSA1/START domain
MTGLSNDPDRVTVQRLIPAPASAIFDLLADPGRHAEIDGSGTVQGPTSSGSRRLALGESFGMSMRMGLAYSTRNVVVEFEPDRVIAWQTLAAAPLDKIVTGRVWRYELEPVDGGTLVRETWDISREAMLSRPLVRRSMAASTRQNMSRTLERIEQVLTGQSPAAPD